jgi:hypothetical protein
MKNRNIQFHRVPAILTGVILLVLATLASSSHASRPQTYSGMLTQSEFFCDGNLIDPQYSVTGTWILSIDATTADPNLPPPASLTLIVFREGFTRPYVLVPHVELTPVSFEEGVYTYSWGPSVTVTLDTTTDPATFSWNVDFHRCCGTQGCTNLYNMLAFVGVAIH